MSQDPQKTMTLTITELYAGQRVDKALQGLFPDLSTRSRKLLWDAWHITLNGRKVSAGAVVSLNDVLGAAPKEGLTPSSPPSAQEKPHLLTMQDGWLFFSKPRGLHSVKVQGGASSLEEYLLQHRAEYGELFLCNRLDAQTSGIVVAASSQDAVRHWQDMENKGLCQKRYVALVQGEVYKARVRAAIDTDKRKISRVLHEEAPMLRHSHFFPLQDISAQEYMALCAYFPAFPKHMPAPLSLVGCTIYKGARHQIRAHAAFAGFPLLGDARYSERVMPEQECFLLHHGALHYENGAVQCAAPWEKALQTTERMAEFFR